MNTKIVAVVAVAVIAVAAVAGVVLMNNSKDGGGGGGGDSHIDDVLGAVYGNANEDYYIDDKDLAIINDIIDKKKEFADYPLADANNDGSVNVEDRIIVQKYINKETVTLQVHDTTKNTGPVTYPVEGLFTCGGTNMRVLIEVLDMEQDMVANATNDYISPVLDKTLYDKKADGTIKTCTTGATDADFETLSKLNFSLAFLEDSGITGYLKEKGRIFFKEWGINVVTFSVDNFDDLKKVVVTGGIIFNSEAKAKEFVELMDGVRDTIKTKLGDKFGTVSVMDIVMSNSVSGRSSDYYAATMMSGGNNLADWDYVNRTFTAGQDTWLYEAKYNPDYLFHFKSMVYGDVPSKEEISGYVTNFKETAAFKNEAYYLMNGTCPLPVRMAFMASTMYPNLVESNWYFTVFQEFFDKFADNPGWDVTNFKVVWNTQELKEIIG